MMWSGMSADRRQAAAVVPGGQMLAWGISYQHLAAGRPGTCWLPPAPAGRGRGAASAARSPRPTMVQRRGHRQVPAHGPVPEPGQRVRCPRRGGKHAANPVHLRVRNEPEGRASAGLPRDPLRPLGRGRALPLTGRTPGPLRASRACYSKTPSGSGSCSASTRSRITWSASRTSAPRPARSARQQCKSDRCTSTGSSTSQPTNSPPATRHPALGLLGPLRPLRHPHGRPGQGLPSRTGARTSCLPMNSLPETSPACSPSTPPTSAASGSQK